jgi:ankyrin repeat protein
VRTATFLLAACLSALASDELFDAARKGDVAAVKAALEKGVPVDAKWRYDQTALFIAAGRGHTDVVKLLLERGAKADARDSFYGMTAVVAAAEKGNAELVTLLLDKGAPGADSILLGAAGRGRTELVRALAKRPGWDPKLLTQALSSAEAGKHAEAASVLREAGAKPAPPLDPVALERFRGRYSTVPQGREVLTVEPKGAFCL